MTRSSAFGEEGEACAARLLERKGFRILDRRYRTPRGEIDIVAIKGGTLVFTEVKARSYEAFGGPAAAVGRAKINRITEAALTYIKERGVKPECIRFDVITIVSGREPEHIENAFIPPRFSY